jgi:aminomethyltransferase
LANDVGRLKQLGKALYSAMLNEEGMVLDDLIVYLAADGYRVVVNCATRTKDLAWMEMQARNFKVTLSERTELAMVAIQGPEAIDLVTQVVNPAKIEIISQLKSFQGLSCESWFIARTGYTGEQGLEIILPNDDVSQFWDDLLAVGVKPIGLGARDTLRLEAGMNLYGSDMDESVTPMESNMAFSVAWKPLERDFIGRSAMEHLGVNSNLIGLVMESRGVLRSHQKVCQGNLEVGEITSGIFSPTLGYSIALARVRADLDESNLDSLSVIIRNKTHPVRMVTPPFVRNGKKVFKDRTEE